MDTTPRGTRDRSDADPRAASGELVTIPLTERIPCRSLSHLFRNHS